MTGRPAAHRGQSPCPSCRRPKPSNCYVCPACWSLLPLVTRVALTKHDTKALARLRQLNQHIDSGQPLAGLEITS
ncbi:hypothetical protein OG216_19630 [Streptomycetaceae bacterium NBC_01309]